LEHHQLVQAVVVASILRAVTAHLSVLKVLPAVAGHASLSMVRLNVAPLFSGTVYVAPGTDKVPMKVEKFKAVSQQDP
jgi:hypothetical protein